MRYGNSLSVAVATFALACPVGGAQAQDATAGEKWQSVAKTDHQEAFVNTTSIVAVGGQLEARVKQNYAQAQPAAKKDKSYLSTRSLYRFDCAQRKIGMKELRAYSGADLQGDVVQKATSKDKNMQWLPAEERTVFGELLDYVCKGVPAG
jgi:hypothetical protein